MADQTEVINGGWIQNVLSQGYAQVIEKGETTHHVRYIDSDTGRWAEAYWITQPCIPVDESEVPMNAKRARVPTE